jgi:hypothetical protein
VQQLTAAQVSVCFSVLSLSSHCSTLLLTQFYTNFNLPKDMETQQQQQHRQRRVVSSLCLLFPSALFRTLQGSYIRAPVMYEQYSRCELHIGSILCASRPFEQLLASSEQFTPI